ncbi:hypothetical protein BDW74DRAFT_176513 [Aspergillus multicolor]|uniref:uncharacterized protein n=1 Tax=Aspergillus multicolor TaxID=41759 RepID=UPI003CCCFBBF
MGSIPPPPYHYYFQPPFYPVTVPQQPVYPPFSDCYFHAPSPPATYPQSPQHCCCSQCTQDPRISQSNNITDSNAQNIFSPTARIMVGNLPRDIDAEMIRSAFNDIGRNFVHLVMGGKYPVAFVQFVTPEQAQQALGKHKRIILNGRTIRVELSKDGQYELGYRSECCGISSAEEALA